jgi:hypothetical protein
MTNESKTTFTDDDLNRLKVCAEKEPPHSVLSRSLKPLLVRLEAAERYNEFTTHESDCILSFWEAGAPTPDGGYRTKYAGKWYQSRPTDETPKCNCGLDQADEAWRKAAGK